MKSLFFVFVSAFFLLNCNPNTESNETLQIKGSDTELNMVQRLAEKYMDNNPEASLAVTGGGSGRGIAALINGQTDIANVSRPLKESEISQLKDNNVKPQKVIIAIDKIAVVVNEQLAGIENISIPALAKIYKGKIQNWKELGGSDLEITLYGRQSNSGTFTFFRNEVLQANYAQSMKNMNGNAQIVEAVKSDKGAIGYVGIGYVMNENDQIIEGLNVLKVSPDENLEGIAPSRRDNGTKDSYPLSRPLYQFFDSNPPQKVQDFITFELSNQGQEIVSQVGYYPINQKYHNQNLANLGFIDEENQKSS